MVPRRSGLAAAALVLLFGAGCTSGGAAPATPRANVVDVTERDFHISAPAHAAPGNLVFSVRNQGPVDHEFIVVRSVGGLPLRSDGITVDEEALEQVTAGALEPGEPDTVRLLHVHLAPGRYLLVCNMYGHYMAGMHTELVVR